MGGKDRARPSGTGSHADAPSHSSVSRPDGFDPARIARESVVAWLRQEANYARHGQDAAETPNLKLYRMGQKDAYLLAADAIERGWSAIATEARRAETPQDGSVHEGAGRQASPKGSGQ